MNETADMANRSDASYLWLEVSALVSWRQNDYLKAPFYLSSTMQDSNEPFTGTPEMLILVLQDPISASRAVT